MFRQEPVSSPVLGLMVNTNYTSNYTPSLYKERRLGLQNRSGKQLGNSSMKMWTRRGKQTNKPHLRQITTIEDDESKHSLTHCGPCNDVVWPPQESGVGHLLGLICQTERLSPPTAHALLTAGIFRASIDTVFRANVSVNFSAEKCLLPPLAFATLGVRRAGSNQVRGIDLAVPAQFLARTNGVCRSP